MAELNDKFEFEQDGKTYNLYNLPDGFVIEGDVNLSKKGLTELPDLFKVTVRGSFSCYNNQLTSLTGAPQKVGGDFECSYNQLTSLEGAPREVGGIFSCHHNQLTSLTGAPQEVSGDFGCGYNQLTSLQGAPRKVGGSFKCGHNKLTSLTGALQKVGGNFWCNDNQLTTLKGAPQEVGKSFICFNNKLTTLKGAPQEVGGDFECNRNQLTTLQGAPQEVGGDFYCSENPDLLSLFGLPQIQEDKGIYCDDELVDRYNCPKAADGGGDYYIKYKDLIESAKYQSELSVYKIRQKKHEEKKDAQAKLKAGFAAFKKMKAEERE